jgi:hypothetical protein
MARKPGFEGLFSQATNLYQAGDVLGAVNDLLHAAQTGEKWAVQCLAYLYGITGGLERLFEKSAITLDSDPVGKLRFELDKWASKRTVSAPSKTSAKTIVVNVKKIEEALKDSNLASELPPLQPATLDMDIAGGTVIVLPHDLAGRDAYAPESAVNFEDTANTTLDSPTPTAPIRIERTPHLDLKSEGPLVPEATLSVEVYVDKHASHIGEKSETVVVDHDADVEVRLITTAHFSINGSRIGSVYVAKHEDTSNAAKFYLNVKAKKDLPKDQSPTITAVFFYNGRPCGSVVRDVEIEGYHFNLPSAARQVESSPPDPASEGRRPALGPPGAPPPQPPESPRPGIDIELGASPADLCVTITKRDSTGLHYSCHVRAPRFRAYADGVEEDWDFDVRTDEIVRSYMNQFTKKKSDANIIAEMRGAGLKFFEKAPQKFKDAFWMLTDAMQPFETISIVSQEAFIPWELMVPVRPDGTENERPLGADYCVARWTDRKNVVAAPQKIRLTDCFIIAPDYADKSKVLKWAKDETALVQNTFAPKAEVIDPAKFAAVTKKLQAELRCVVHFVCHGKEDSAGIQTIDLMDEELSSNAVSGMRDLCKAFREKRPMVFLNACQVGRPTRALVGIGGFADAFIQIGASAVVAALWSVVDETARLVAEEFYKGVTAEPTRPFAAILRDVRRKAYESGAKDTYAAYCFYGDPAAIGTDMPPRLAAGAQIG